MAEKGTGKNRELNRRRGRRNRQRGAELQREVVNLAKSLGLESFNRDRGGAQHEMGDVEIDGVYFGCKRRKRVPAWVMPEKQEKGVFWRSDGGKLMVSVDALEYMTLVMEMNLNNRLSNVEKIEK